MQSGEQIQDLGVTVVLDGCYSGRKVVLQLCYNDVIVFFLTVVIQWCYGP
jgi:hypothetical protein